MMTPRWLALGQTVAGPGRARLMAIVNATPDSFSDGGLAFDRDAAIARAHAVVAEGADLVDLGGESSRPGAEPVGLDEEIRRTIPVIEALAGSLPVPISIDTVKPEVARRALAAGAAIVNDIRGLDDPEMLAVVAESEAGVVLMHRVGTPQTMQIDPRYDDVVAEVHAALAAKVERAVAAGIDRSRIAVDPGIGFGKRSVHNLALLRHLDRLAGLGCVVLIGTSRKRFLRDLTGRDVSGVAAGSIASALAGGARGAGGVRGHDVRPTADALAVWDAIARA